MAWRYLTLFLVCTVLADDEPVDFLRAAVNRGSVNLLKEAIAEAEGANVVASPLGAFLLVALYSAGTSGKLRSDITSVLGADNYTTLFNKYSELSQGLSKQDASVLTLANKVYVATGRKFTTNFENAAKSYNSEVAELDFSNAKAAAAEINKWAEEKTKGHIKDPIKENMISSAVATALFNVIYFQGNWQKPFKPEETEPLDFMTKSGPVKKPMMKQEESINYLENPELGGRMVELPYKEDGFSMMIVLPDKPDGLPTMMEKLTANPDLLNNEMKRFHKNYFTLLDLQLPKFDIKTKLDLKSIFKKIGLSRLFSDGASDIVKDSNVKVDEAFQEAFIEVDEQGSKAGAFTGITAVLLSAMLPPPKPVVFHVTHPFLFAILHKKTVLFIGTYNQ